MGALFRKPLPGGFCRRLYREGLQPIDPRSLRQARPLLVPICAFPFSFFVHIDYRSAAWDVKAHCIPISPCYNAAQLF